MEQENQLKADIRDLLNQLLVKLDKVQVVELSDNDDSDGYSNLAELKSDDDGKPNKLGCIKLIATALLEDLDSQRSYTSDAQKMARAYYTSFCNA